MDFAQQLLELLTAGQAPKQFGDPIMDRMLGTGGAVPPSVPQYGAGFAPESSFPKSSPSQMPAAGMGPGMTVPKTTPGMGPGMPPGFGITQPQEGPNMLAPPQPPAPPPVQPGTMPRTGAVEASAAPSFRGNAMGLFGRGRGGGFARFFADAMAGLEGAQGPLGAAGAGAAGAMRSYQTRQKATQDQARQAVTDERDTEKHGWERREKLDSHVKSLLDINKQLYPENDPEWVRKQVEQRQKLLESDQFMPYEEKVKALEEYARSLQGGGTQGAASKEAGKSPTVKSGETIIDRKSGRSLRAEGNHFVDTKSGEKFGVGENGELIPFEEIPSM